MTIYLFCEETIVRRHVSFEQGSEMISNCNLGRALCLDGGTWGRGGQAGQAAQVQGH